MTNFVGVPRGRHTKRLLLRGEEDIHHLLGELSG